MSVQRSVSGSQVRAQLTRSSRYFWGPSNAEAMEKVGATGIWASEGGGWPATSAFSSHRGLLTSSSETRDLSLQDKASDAFSDRHACALNRLHHHHHVFLRLHARVNCTEEPQRPWMVNALEPPHGGVAGSGHGTVTSVRRLPWSWRRLSTTAGGGAKRGRGGPREARRATGTEATSPGDAAGAS